MIQNQIFEPLGDWKVRQVRSILPTCYSHSPHPSLAASWEGRHGHHVRPYKEMVAKRWSYTHFFLFPTMAVNEAFTFATSLTLNPIQADIAQHHDPCVHQNISYGHHQAMICVKILSQIPRMWPSSMGLNTHWYLCTSSTWHYQHKKCLTQN